MSSSDSDDFDLPEDSEDMDESDTSSDDNQQDSSTVGVAGDDSDDSEDDDESGKVVAGSDSDDDGDDDDDDNDDDDDGDDDDDDDDDDEEEDDDDDSESNDDENDDEDDSDDEEVDSDELEELAGKKMKNPQIQSKVPLVSLKPEKKSRNLVLAPKNVETKAALKKAQKKAKDDSEDDSESSDEDYDEDDDEDDEDDDEDDEDDDEDDSDEEEVDSDEIEEMAAKKMKIPQIQSKVPLVSLKHEKKPKNLVLAPKEATMAKVTKLETKAALKKAEKKAKLENVKVETIKSDKKSSQPDDVVKANKNEIKRAKKLEKLKAMSENHKILSLYLRFPKKLPKDVDELKKMAQELCPRIVQVSRPRQASVRWCLVSFENSEDREKALVELRNVKVDGKKLFANYPRTDAQELIEQYDERRKKKLSEKRAKNKLKMSLDANRINKTFTSTLIVRNIPASASVDELKSHFPDAVDFKLIYGKKDKTKNTAVVDLPTPKSATLVQRKNIQIGDVQLKISFATQTKAPAAKKPEAQKNTPDGEETKPENGGNIRGKKKEKKNNKRAAEEDRSLLSPAKKTKVEEASASPVKKESHPNKQKSKPPQNQKPKLPQNQKSKPPQNQKSPQKSMPPQQNNKRKQISPVQKMKMKRPAVENSPAKGEKTLAPSGSNKQKAKTQLELKENQNEQKQIENSVQSKDNDVEPTEKKTMFGRQGKPFFKQNQPNQRGPFRPGGMNKHQNKQFEFKNRNFQRPGNKQNFAKGENKPWSKPFTKNARNGPNKNFQNNKQKMKNGNVPAGKNFVKNLK